MQFAILLLLTLGLVMPASQAVQPMIPKLNGHIKALESIAICRAVTRIEQRPALKKISEGTLTSSEVRSVQETMEAHELLFSRASLFHVANLTAALIVDNPNIFNDLEQEVEQRFVQTWDEIDDTAKKEWVGHCRHIQTSISN